MTRLRLVPVALAMLATAVSASAQVPAVPSPTAPAPPSRFNEATVEEKKEPPKAIGLVTGIVVNGLDQTPVPAAVVTMTPTGRNAFQFGSRVITDQNGRFFFRDIEVGTFEVQVDKPGWIAGAHGRYRPGGFTSSIKMEEGQRRTLRLSMWRPAVISGRVVDETGEPFIRAAVRVYQRTFQAGRPQWTYRTRVWTDDRGMYRFPDLMPGNYTVVVPATVTSEPPGLRFQTPLPETYLLTMTANGAGPVMDVGSSATHVTRQGQPLIGSALGMRQLPAAEGQWMTYPTTFFPAAPTIGAATVIAAAAGRERANADITVRLTPTVQVSGSVTQPDGAPAQFFAVHLLPGVPSDQAVLDVATAITDANGQFTFFGVPAGPYVARVVKIPKTSGSPQDRASTCGGTGAVPYVCVITGPNSPVPTDPLLFAEQALTVGGDGLRNVGLLLRPGVRVTGRIEFEGTAERPAPQDFSTASIWLERADGRAAEPANGFDSTPVGRFAPDGTFSTPSTAPGRYLLRAGMLGRWFIKSATYEGRDISQTPLELTGDIRDVVFTLTEPNSRPGIQVTVVDAEGKPDDKAIVVTFPTDRARWIDYGRRTRSFNTAKTFDDGKTNVAPPPDGEYFMVAIPDEQLIDFHSPALFEKLATIATRVHIIESQPMQQNLQTKRVP
jgi:hypothetical protein